MTIGTGTFSPHGQFAFPRSYIAGVQVCSAGFTLTQTLNTFEISFAPIFPSIYYIVFNIDFWFWSSNCYTLDHVLDELYYKDFPADSHHPLDYNLNWSRAAAPHHPILILAPNHNFSTPQNVTFTSIVPGYWTQPT